MSSRTLAQKVDAMIDGWLKVFGFDSPMYKAILTSVRGEIGRVCEQRPDESKKIIKGMIKDLQDCLK